MTGKRESWHLGWSLPLGLGGLAIAVLVAFMAADSNDRQRDDDARQILRRMAFYSNCAFSITGAAPASEDEVMSIIGERTRQLQDGACRLVDGPFFQTPVRTSYTRLDASHVELCAEFRRARGKAELQAHESREPIYAVFDQPRPAGYRCYAIELVPVIPPPVAPTN